MGMKDGKQSLLCYVKSIMIFLGVLPYQLVNFDKRAYTIYKYLMQGTFFCILILFYLEIPRFHGPPDQLFKSVGILSTYSILYVKGLVCMSKNMNELILDLVSYESKIKTSDEDIYNIYTSIVKRSKTVQMYYIILTYSTGVSFFEKGVNYALSSDEIKFSSTLEAHRSLPYAMWLPIDEKEHYWIALIFQIFCALLAINYYCFVQCILIVLPLNITLRLNILASKLSHIKSPKSTCGPNVDESSNMERINEDVTLCIKEHLDVIGKCSTLNNSIKYLMLLEFLLSSAQISIALILLTTTNDLNVKLFSVVYLIQILSQLLILYWHADEIREKSIAICDVLYEMQWYDLNKSINGSIQLMMLRSQRPLLLNVGPFGEMSLAMYVKIIRAAYTYVMFMRQTYGVKET